METCLDRPYKFTFASLLLLYSSLSFNSTDKVANWEPAVSHCCCYLCLFPVSLSSSRHILLLLPLPVSYWSSSFPLLSVLYSLSSIMQPLPLQGSDIDMLKVHFFSKDSLLTCVLKQQSTSCQTDILEASLCSRPLLFISALLALGSCRYTAAAFCYSSVLHIMGSLGNQALDMQKSRGWNETWIKLCTLHTCTHAGDLCWNKIDS